MYRVRAEEAQYPLPFPQRLEYNAPVHGTWNIVHISMLVPESHSIYVCSDNCMRGVVMTAAEMGCQDRFSCVTLSEMDVMTDNLETITIEGAADVIEHLEKRPKIIFLFLVCLHIFVSSDEEYILKKLRERYPDICFVRCYMDCVRQKTGPTPDMKLRGFEYEPVLPREKVPGRVNVLGCDLPYAPDSELIRHLRECGCDPLQLQDCGTYEEYQRLGEAQLNICTYMNAQSGIGELSERLDCGYLYLPPAVDYEEIREEYRSLHAALKKIGAAEPGSDESATADKSETGEGQNLRESWFAAQESLCEAALGHLKERLSGLPVAIDYTCHQRPLGIAKLLLAHGIRVKTVYLDGILPEEEPALDWLREHAPQMELIATMRPQMIRRDAVRDADGRGVSAAAGAEPAAAGEMKGPSDGRTCIRVLALGQKAAWFEQTPYFVNMIESGGLWGYEGIRGLCRLMEEALGEAKDLRDIVPRKGMGWPSLCDVPSRQADADPDRSVKRRPERDPAGNVTGGQRA